MVFSSNTFLFCFLPICLSGYSGGYLVNYAEKYPNKRIKKILCFLVICINILFLGYWKYLNFFADSLRSIVGMDLAIEKITLPVGISFFTFQGISYVIDVYRKQVPVQKQIINVGLYIALFPQLIAGPIVRYSDINQEIIHRKHSPKMFAEGIVFRCILIFPDIRIWQLVWGECSVFIYWKILIILIFQALFVNFGEDGIFRSGIG